MGADGQFPQGRAPDLTPNTRLHQVRKVEKVLELYLHVDTCMYYVSVRGSVDPRLEALGQLKNSVALSGIEPATFSLVA
jgi:hypothetical protein